MQEDLRDTVRKLAGVAGVPVSEDRVAALAALLRFLQPNITLLAEIDYGDAEPAGRFRPPPTAKR
jgi:hypothetical protein